MFSAWPTIRPPQRLEVGRDHQLGQPIQLHHRLLAVDRRGVNFGDTIQYFIVTQDENNNLAPVRSAAIRLRPTHLSKISMVTETFTAIASFQASAEPRRSVLVATISI